jgi:hypothetical protein
MPYPHSGKTTTPATGYSHGIKMVMSPPGFQHEARFVHLSERCPEHSSPFPQPVPLGYQLATPYKAPRSNYRRWKYEEVFKPTWPKSHGAALEVSKKEKEKDEDEAVAPAEQDHAVIVKRKAPFLPSVAYFSDDEWPEDKLGEDEDTSLYYTAPSKQSPTLSAACVFTEGHWPEDDFADDTSEWYIDHSSRDFDLFPPSSPEEFTPSSSSSSSDSSNSSNSSRNMSAPELSTGEDPLSDSDDSVVEPYEAALGCLKDLDADIERLNMLFKLLQSTRRRAKLNSRARQKQRKQQRDLDRESDSVA